jgi:hypothetical protein
MARNSRPPGFDMTYRPERREAFGPPMLQRLPSYGCLLAAALGAVAVWWAPNTRAGSFLHTWVVEGDRMRLVPVGVIALVLCGTALAAVLRTEMRGVVVGPEGIELRELLPLGLPRVRRFAWSEIDRVRIPRFASDGRVDGRIAGAPKRIRMDLWDGSQTLVPDVARTKDLALILERVALARAIPMEGGTGLLDDLTNPFEGDGGGEEEAA